LSGNHESVASPFFAEIPILRASVVYNATHGWDIDFKATGVSTDQIDVNSLTASPTKVSDNHIQSILWQLLLPTALPLESKEANCLGET
jgi:hypothetical protein